MSTSQQAGCVVVGCGRASDGESIDFSGAAVVLCGQHHAELDADPLLWDGDLNEDGTAVVRLWRREGVGSAS